MLKEANQRISQIITKKLAEGYDQNEAVSIALEVADSGASTEKASDCVKTYAVKEADVDMEAMQFQGYASTWDKDEVDDIIMPGAFTRTLKQRGPQGSNRIKVLWQHMDALGKPLEMREDDVGLFVKAQISDTTLGRDAMTLIKDGVVDSMSIGFSIPQGKADFAEDQWTRYIREVKLYEFSPVTFPANEEATIEMAARITRSHTGEHLSEQSKQRIKQSIDQLRDALETQGHSSTMGTAQPQHEKDSGEDFSAITDSFTDLKTFIQSR